MALVIDTDVVSFVFKHDTRAALYTPHQLERMWFVYDNHGPKITHGNYSFIRRVTANSWD